MGIVPIQSTYSNPFQQYFHALRPHKGYVISSRATGKTSEILALHTIRQVSEMPRSLGGLVGSSYAQIVERVFPALIQGLGDFGWLEGRDFVIGKFHKKWLLPVHRYPSDGTHFLHFKNGAGIQMVSQDRVGLANGLEFSWVFGDEARFLNYERLQEFLLTVQIGRASCRERV